MRAALENLELLEELNPVNRLLLTSLMEAQSFTHFFLAFNNEIFFLKEMDPLESPAEFVNLLPLIAINLNNFHNMVNRFVKPDFRNKLLNDKNWCQIDKESAKIAKDLFSRNDALVEIILDYRNDLRNLYIENGLEAF